MSTQRTSTTIEEKVRARIALGLPDAPVFAAAFYNAKKHVSHREQVVFAAHTAGDASALCADPGSGQTPGFAHRTDIQGQREKATASVRNLREDPTLLRVPQQSELLRRHLQRRVVDTGVADVIHPQSFPQEMETSGVQLAPSSWKPPLPPTRFEVLRREFVRGRGAVKGLVLHFIRVIQCANIASRISEICVHFAKKALWISKMLFDLFCAGSSLFGDVWYVGEKKLQVVTRAIVGSMGRYGREFFRTRTYRVRIRLPSVSLPRVSLAVPSRRFMARAGQGLIVLSLVLLLMTVGPILRLQAGEWWQQTRSAVTGKASEPAVRETLMDAVRKPEEVPPEEKQFQLLIPKLDANLKVIANVDAGDEKAYSQALARGVAHAAGSGLPGEANTTNRTIYIFGHSTNGAWNIKKYNALFYSLKDLVVGDEIIVWFWGKEFQYKVSTVVKIDPSDLSYLAPQTVKDQLILQTCWPPGTVWKRLLVIATPVGK